MLAELSHEGVEGEDHVQEGEVDPSQADEEVEGEDQVQVEEGYSSRFEEVVDGEDQVHVDEEFHGGSDGDQDPSSYHEADHEEL